MKKLNTKEMKDTELTAMLKEKSEGLQHFRFNITGGKIKNVKGANTMKKDIARILTAQKARMSK